MKPKVHVDQVIQLPEMEAVRALFVKYTGTLPFDLGYQCFDDEIGRFPGKYAPPGRALYLAQVNSLPSAAIGLRALAPNVAEVKRMFYRSAHQGLGISRMLVERIMERGMRISYGKLRLDTIRDLMAPAEELDRSAGFIEIPAYYDNPIPNAVYYELTLT